MNNQAKLSKQSLIIIGIFIILALIAIYFITKSLALSSPPAQCNDRIDNDADGRCDYGPRARCTDGSAPGDSGCTSKSDNSECSPTTEICDGLDNDCDGIVDDNLGTTTCGVGACQVTVNNCVNGQTQTCTPGTPVPEICTDTIDNDCDGVVNNGCNPNSCSDTDGGIVKNITGTVSGYKNNLPYSSTDFCQTNITLREFYCSGTSAFNTTIGCVGNGTTSCNSGACI